VTQTLKPQQATSLLEAVRHEEYVILLAVLIHIRRDKAIDCDRCSEDLNDVLHALKITGQCLVPCGAIDALKESLVTFGTKATTKIPEDK
jgi:hypothetical protein